MIEKIYIDDLLSAAAYAEWDNDGLSGDAFKCVPFPKAVRGIEL